jgi:hypothetical protein
MRRCGVAATGQTPEIVEIAQECLFFLMLSLASRGVNLWCIDKKITEAVVGKKTYVLPAGTIDVLNCAYSTATYVTGTNTSAATSYQVLLATATAVVRVGMTFSALPTSDVTLQFSDDGATWTTATTVKVADLPAVNVRGWYDMNISGAHAYYRIYAAAAALTATEMLLCSTINDLPINPMNRDDYTSLPNKDSAGSPAVNYFFEKLVDPQITLWPVPNVASNHFCVWRHRQIQDVGTLTQSLELPNRWFESIIWQLAARLVFELPSGVVPPDRVKMVMGMNKDMQVDTESGENDGAPTFYTPGIGVYSA